jgi:hypothetical protein
VTWELVYYATPDRSVPVHDYLQSAELTEVERGNVKARIEFLKEKGPLAGRAYKQLTGQFSDLSEITIMGQHNVRIFYFIDERRRVVLLDGVSKGGRRDHRMRPYYRRALKYHDDWVERCV